MKRIRWQILVVVLAMIAIGVLLIGQKPTLLPVVPEIEPTTGGVYIEGLVGSLGRLNPVLDYHNPADRDINRLIFSGLMRYDSRGLPQMDLVESMGISQDGLIYNFSLRANAKWHDGEPLTSDDVVFTIDQLRNDDLPIPADIRTLWKDVEVEALNEHTLQIRLPEPFAPFMDYLTFGILPEHLLGDLAAEELVEARFNLEPVGSGPYRFEGLMVEGEQILGVALQAFEEYYGEKAFIQQFVFRFYPDSASALAAYQAGDVLGISQVTPDVLPAALKEPELKLNTGRLPRLSMILFNLDNPEVAFFQNAALRRALLTGLNRQRMVDTILGGQAIVADGPILPGSWAHYDGIEHINYDSEQAVAALKEAGFTIPATGGNVRENEEGQRLEFELLHPEGEPYTSLAESAVRDWARLGVEVTLKPVSYEALLQENLDPRTYQAALVEFDLSRTPDPDPYPFWHQAQITGGQNYSKWDDRQASEYLEQARVTTDIAERSRLYRNFQVRFTAEMPALPLYYPVYNYAIDAQIQGVTMGPLFDPSDRFATANTWFLLVQRAENGDETPVAGEGTATVAP